MTFSGRKNPQNLLMQCAPLLYSKGNVEGDGLSCYYFWDFKATNGDHFLALPPSQIVTMELAEGTFKTEDFSSFKKTAVSTKNSVT
ncbi:MAG: hypothetical protein H8D56_05345 [Planctomycetes bacterium]|nr:hypothetical protein [Planctomycetota bacterium]MBL7145816.1 hypothetical protein [Phycisphaerae bacterium]